MIQYDRLHDEELAALAQSGEAAAEELLLERYKPIVKSRAHLYFIVGADAEDVIQEGMIGIFKAIRSYREDRDASFRTFAGVCINRQIITAIKAASRKKHQPLNSSVSFSAPAESPGGSETIENLLAASLSNPEELLLMQDRMEQLLGSIPELLSGFEKEVWDLYLGGWNYNRIAEKIARTPKSVDNAIQRIKRKIAAEYY